MDENRRIERGWIYLDGTQQGDGPITFGAGIELRFTPFDAMAQRHENAHHPGQHSHGVRAAARVLASTDDREQR